MAVIVSGVFCFILGLFLFPACTWASVFLDPDRAHSVLGGLRAGPDPVLVRTRRANSIMEELRTGNLERECYEEKCSYEEAREIFPHRKTLEAFWIRYQAGDPCYSDPCQNGATCTRHVLSFTCKCAPGYHGQLCDKVRTTTSQSCRHRNGGCEHFCSDTTEYGQICSCADGFRLARDNASCSPTVEVPCGRPQVLFAPRVVNGQVCPRGLCPWQAMLTENHVFICGAVLLSPHWVLTAAHCVFPKPTSVFHITVGEHDRSVPENTEQKRRVVKVLVNPNYNRTSSDSDLALLKLYRDVKLGRYVVPVCLPGPKDREPDLSSGLVRTLASVRVSTVSGWGRVAQHGHASDILQRLNVPRVRTLDCRAHTRLNISKNMLCFGLRSGGQDSCEGDSGGPLVTRFKKTWFLTGIVSWGRGCAEKNQYGVYTRVPNYLPWIYRSMESHDSPRGDTSVTPRAEAPATPRGDKSALARGNTSASPRGDKSVPPKVEMQTTPRVDKSAPPKAEVPVTPRGDTSAPPKGKIPVSPREDTSVPSKAEMAATPREETSAPHRGNTSASSRGDTSVPRKAEAPAIPKGDTSASPRGNTSHSLKGDTSVIPKAEVPDIPQEDTSASPKGNTSHSVRVDTSVIPKAEVPDTPKEDTSASPRGNTSHSLRVDTSVIFKAEVPDTPKEDTSASPRGNTSHSLREDTSVIPKAEVPDTPKEDTSASPRGNTSHSPRGNTSVIPKADVLATPGIGTSVPPRVNMSAPKD